MPSTKGGNHFLVGAETVTPVASGLLVGGQAMYFIDRSRNPAAVDSSVGAFLLSNSMLPVRIRRPFTESISAPRLASLGGDSAIITFGRPLKSADGTPAGDSIGLWVATIRDKTFGEPRLFARMSSPPGITTETLSNLVRVGNDVIQVVVLRDPADASWQRVGLVRFRGDSISVELADLGVSHIAAVDLTVHAGRLFLAVVATARETDGAAGLWYSERRQAGWTSAVNVVAAGRRWLGEPRLLSTSAGLVLAYSEYRPGGSMDIGLHWRGIADSGDTTTHTLAARWPTFRGEQPFQHLLSVLTDSSHAKVLQLLPSGSIEIATIPVGVPRAPIIGGRPERPVAVGLIRSDRDSAEVQVATFDLRCGLGAMRPPRP